jgi:hypothetical protein
MSRAVHYNARKFEEGHLTVEHVDERSGEARRRSARGSGPGTYAAARGAGARV